MTNSIQANRLTDRFMRSHTLSHVTLACRADSPAAPPGPPGAPHASSSSSS